ncbi:MAG: CHASE2 domain-containing protein [Cyanobacteriota bacterium]|nr:CHASE2 domain-containing protein [Cyanobacteriota bacterium]
MTLAKSRKLNIRSGLWKWRVPFTIALGVTGLTLALSGMGMFQLLEWAALDRYFRLRPIEPRDARILIVEVDEPDLAQLGQWPVSDATLARALKNLRARGPRAIGLDLYRDLVVEPGHAQLKEVFASTPNLIGVEKFAGDAVAPPPVLKQSDRVAINDIVLDTDGKVRRGLLSVRRDEKTQLGLGAKLALMYLDAKGIAPTSTDDEAIEMGKARFTRFESNDGGYVRADAGGYQILLNFRGPPRHFETVSFFDLLHDRVPTELIRDRLVFVGVTARSLNDFFYNPYTTDEKTTPAGVEIHAHLASGIVSAVLEGRPLITTFWTPVEGSWIFLWCGASALCGCWLPRHKQAAIGLVAAIGSPLVLAYFAFLGGWWLPGFTPSIAATASAALSLSCTLWSQLKRSHQQLAIYAQTLEGKVRERTVALECQTVELARKTTQLERQTADLATARDAAEAANRAKSLFLAHMSHELRTPLNAILGFTQLMTRSQTLPCEHRENLQIVTRSGEHLLSLIENVLDFSKIEAGKIDLQLSDFNLHRLLYELEAMFSLQARNKGLVLTLEVAAGVPEYVRADKVKVRQILTNAIANGVKFTKVGGVAIAVSIRDEADDNGDRTLICFAIEDTGPGIAAEELNGLFEPFVQTQAGKNAQKGTGLGLTIARQFAERMGGRVAIESQVGTGSTFYIQIPMARAIAPVDRETCESPQEIDLKIGQPAPKILVVDDRQDNRRILLEILQPMGFAVREARHGAEAIDIWEAWQPDFIWMDVRMPVMDGLQATRCIRAKERDWYGYERGSKRGTAIVALSADAQKETDGGMLAAGCNAVTHKPIREREILETLTQHLGIRYKAIAPETMPIESSHPKLAVLLTQLREILPPTWFVELKHAAIAIDNEKILQLIRQIPQEWVPIVRQIQEWVETFRCDRIVEFLESDRSDKLADLNADLNEVTPDEQGAGAVNIRSQLCSMPREWVAQIYWAAAIGSDIQLCHLLETMPVPNAALAEQLSSLAIGFEFETVMELTEFATRPHEQPIAF